MREDGKTAPILESLGNASIKYLHRTAKDFLDNDPIFANIQQATAGTDFHIWSSLLKSLSLQLKICESPKHKCHEFETVLELPLEIAYAAQEERNTSNVRLLDDLGKSLSRLRPAPVDFTNPMSNSNTYEDFDESWPDNFLTLATRYSLSTYLAVKLAIPNAEPR